MSHKGNYNVTELARISLSLQELIERQAAEIVKLKEDLAGARRMLGVQTTIRKQHEAKIEKQQEMIKWDLDLLEKQNQVMNDYQKFLDRLQRPLLQKLADLIRGK